MSPRFRWEDQFCVHMHTHLSLVGFRTLPLLACVPWDTGGALKRPGESNDLHFLDA